MEYCPGCLSNTLKISGSGIVQIIINGKPKDNARVLFNITKTDQFETDLRTRLEDFLKWLGSFKNLEAEKRVQIVTSDFRCSSDCKIPMTLKFSVVGILITNSKLSELLKDLGKKYSMDLIVQES